MTAPHESPGTTTTTTQVTAPAGGEVTAEALLERAAAGDATAMLTLYDRFAPVLMALAVRVVGTRAEAEDVVQDALTRAWREAGSFDRTRGSAVAWLATLTRNRAIDIVRSRRRRDDFQAGEAQTSALPVSTPELEVSVAQRAAAVRAALGTLTADQRAVLDLAYFGGLSHSEIAARLGQPLGTVKTRIAQAVRRLRDELQAVIPAADGSESS